MYFLRMGDMHVLGSSPEMLVRVTGRKLEYRPIAGTHPRGKDEAEDDRLEQPMLTRRKRTRRARHAGRPGPQRSRTGQRIRFGESPRPDVCGALLARDASGVGAGREAAPRAGRHRRVCRLLSCGHAERRAQGSRHADYRRTRTDPTGCVRRSQSCMRISPATWIPASPSAPC